MVSSYTDQVLTCKDCGAQFVFTTGEQEFYASHGFQNAPSRCSTCRTERKARQSQSEPTGLNGRRDNSGSPRVAREMHTATCSQCGKQAQVPFLPRGDKPVYCSECYEQIRAQR